MRTLSSLEARRLAITRQRLAGPRPPRTPEGILGLVRELGCLQIDPTSVVARSHLLVLWSRLGRYDPAHLNTLLWEERRLFEDWAHAASIVLTEDYPIFRALKSWPRTGDQAWARRFRAWLARNAGLRRHILVELRRRGPLLSRQIEDKAVTDWQSTGWTVGRNVGRMLAYLWHAGRIMVAGRANGQKLWDLTERCLPAWTPRERLSQREIVRRAAQRSLRALGVATPRQIAQHFIRNRYPDLARVLRDLEAEGRIERVQVRDRLDVWPGDWFIHADDLPLLDRLRAGDWRPRTRLLSPFDNLICDRARTRQLFGFDFTLEIYVPPPQRRYGFFVMPILHGDRLIGRIDPALDRERGVLTVRAVHAEPDAPRGREAGLAITAAVEDLAAFLGASGTEHDRGALWPPR
ncbi:MAG: crosslink repair DNA glycosylase YcaQ family protein [Armatimonadota bacterium]|nr:crosslink repair DNA glycosylase YcaQ family protein [Armatimonadota bacterium]